MKSTNTAFKSTNQLNDEMRKAVAQAKAASAVAAKHAARANALLAEIKSRKVAVVEFLDESKPMLGTSDVMSYRNDGSTVMNLAPNRIGRAG